MSEKIIWGHYNFKGNPAKVYGELSTLGETTPESIVEYARDNKDSELHKCFTWDDTIAAEKWRKQEARLIVCSLQVVVEREQKEPQTFRLIQQDKSEEVYRPVVFTVRNQDQYQVLLKQAKAELLAFKKRYGLIVELSSVIDEIDKIVS